MKKLHFLFVILSLNINAYVDIKGSRYRYILGFSCTSQWWPQRVTYCGQSTVGFLPILPCLTLNVVISCEIAAVLSLNSLDIFHTPTLILAPFQVRIFPCV